MLNLRLFKIIDWVAYIFLLLTTVAVPLLMDGRLTNFYIIPKQYVFIGLTLITFLLFAVKVVLSKRLEYRRTVIDLPILVFLGLGLLSSIFSTTSTDSFFGRSDYFVINFLFVIFAAVFYFLFVNFVKTPKHWLGFMDALIGVGGLTAILFILKAVFKVSIFSGWFGDFYNTLDKVNTPFGLWMIVIFVLAAGQLIKKNLALPRSIIYFIVTALSFWGLVLLSFPVLWWILLAGIVLLLLIGVNFVKEARMGWLSALFAILVAIAIFIAFGTPKSLQSSIPPEVYLGARPSWSITSDTVLSGVKNFLLGSGLGTFGVDFSKFRSVDFNYDQMAWSLRFSQPFSTFFAILAEGGILLAVVFVFLILFVLGHVFQAWYKNRGALSVGEFGGAADERAYLGFDIFLLSAVWVLLCASMTMVFFGPVLWWLWWLVLGLVITGLGFLSDKIISVKEWAVDDSPQYSLSFSFTLIVVIAFVVLAGIFGARLYIAEVNYASALRSNDLNVAEVKIKNALAQRNNFDSYHAALAQVYVLKAAEASKLAKPDTQMVSAYVAEAVNEAKKATDISPSSVALWENLTTMYENAAMIIPEARDWAIKSLNQAKALEPTNPVLLWRLGNNLSVAGKWEEAMKDYQAAIALKSDYLAAYIALSNAYEQTRQLDKAVETYVKVMPYASGNPEALFNLGRLLYNRNKGEDRNDAEKLWLEAIKQQPNYSNALYSLGLMYENRGQTATALEYYYKVKELNPDNKDVSVKIKSLVGGTGITTN